MISKERIICAKNFKICRKNLEIYEKNMSQQIAYMQILYSSKNAYLIYLGATDISFIQAIAVSDSTFNAL